MVVVLTVAAIGGWLLRRPSGHTAPTAGPAPATAQGDPVPGPNQARLMRMLPSGYSAGSCEPATTPPRALAKTVCTHNGDPAGPTAATYTLVAEKASLRPLFDDPLRGSTIVTCPGNISRPDPGAATPRPSKSAARWCAATASQRSPGPPSQPARPATSMPIELGRRSTSSTNGGRRTPDVPRPGPPRRLPTPTRQTPRRRRDPQTRSPRVRVAVWLRLPQRSLPRRPPVLATAPTAEAPAALLMPGPAGPAPICLPSGLRLWTAVRCAQGHGLRCAPGPRPGPLWNCRPGSSR